MSAGIYRIVNVVTGKSYVGQSLNLKRRETVHRSALKNGRHGNLKLQHSFNLHGPDAFVFETVFVLDTGTTDRQMANKILNEKEKEYIAKFDTLKNGYNLNDGGDVKMVSDETRERMRKSHAGQKGHAVSEETKAKLSILQKSRVRTDKERADLAERARKNFTGKPSWNKGLRYSTAPCSEERKKKISLAQMGDKNHNFGRKIPEEVKQKCRDSYHGEQCHLAKLTDDIVRVIKKDLAAGVSGAVLARRYNVTTTAISGIKTGLTWKHIQDVLP